MALLDIITNLFQSSAIGKINSNYAKLNADIDSRLKKDGSTFMTGPLDMNGKRVINAGVGINDTDLATVATIRTLLPAISKGDKGDKGDPGTPGADGSGSVYRASLAAVQAANTTEGISIYNGATYRWQLGDYAALVAADTVGAMYVKATLVSASVGAWVRQGVTLVNFTWFGAVPGTDSTTACKTAATVAGIAGLPMTITPAAQPYLIRDTIPFASPFIGLSSRLCRFKAFSAADFASGKALIECDTTDIVFRDFLIEGLAVRNSGRSGDQSTSNFNGDGLRLTSNANKIKLYNVRVEACRRGFDYQNEFGHINAYGCAASNCWWNLWLGKNTGDYGFWGCDFDGPLFASIGAANTFDGGTKPGGISAAVFEQCHLGFGPYGLHQATGGTASVALLDITFIHCRFEQIGNRAISVSGTNTASIRWTGVGHSWSTFDAYKILGDAAHPVQDYARVFTNISGGSAGSTMRDEGTGWYNGSSGFHTLVNGFIQHFWTDTLGTAGYNVVGTGIERISDGSQPMGYLGQNTVAKVAIASAAPVTVSTFVRPARHKTAQFFTINGAIDYSATNNIVAQIKVNGNLLQTVVLPSGSGTFPLSIAGQLSDASLALTIENASGLTLYNQSNSGRLTYAATYAAGSV